MEATNAALIAVADAVESGEFGPEVLKIIDRQILHSPAIPGNEHPPGLLGSRFSELVRAGSDDSLMERRSIRAAMSILGKLMRDKRPPDDPTERRVMAAVLRRVASGETPVYLGDGRIKCGDETFNLTQNQACIIEALLKHGAMTLDELRRATLNEQPYKTTKTLLKRFPALEPHLIPAGGKGKGGYRTTIIDGR